MQVWGAFKYNITSQEGIHQPVHCTSHTSTKINFLGRFYVQGYDSE